MVEMDLTEFREAAVGFGNKYIYEGIRNKVQTLEEIREVKNSSPCFEGWFAQDNLPMLFHLSANIICKVHRIHR